MNKLESAYRLKPKLVKSFPGFSLIFVWVPGFAILNQALLFQYIFQLNENIYFINRKGNEFESDVFMHLPHLIANYVSLYEQINNICTYIYQSCL